VKQDAGEDVIKLLSVHSPQNQIALHRKFFIEVFEVKVFKEKDFTIFKATQEELDPVGYNNAHCSVEQFLEAIYISPLPSTFQLSKFKVESQGRIRKRRARASFSLSRERKKVNTLERIVY